MKNILFALGLLGAFVMGTAEAKLPDFNARAREAVGQSLEDAAAKQRKADYTLYLAAGAGSGVHPEAMRLYDSAMNRELRHEAERSMERSKGAGETSRHRAMPGGAEKLRKEEEQRELDRKAVMKPMEALRQERYRAGSTGKEKVSTKNRMPLGLRF